MIEYFRYNPRIYYDKNVELRQCIDQIASGYFSPENPDMFKEIAEHLLNHDRFMLCADFEAYIQCQDRVSQLYTVSYGLLQI